MSNVEELRRTETDLHDDVSRADRLRQFMEEFGVQEHLADYERQLTKAMVDTKPHEDDARRHYRDAVHTARYVALKFREILSQGELSRDDLNKIGKKKLFG